MSSPTGLTRRRYEMSAKPGQQPLSTVETEASLRIKAAAFDEIELVLHGRDPASEWTTINLIVKDTMNKMKARWSPYDRREAL